MAAQEHVARIVERLRKDHPDPAIREELYAEPDRLRAYVETLMMGHDGDVAAIAEAVRAADDGQPHHAET